LSNLCRSLLNRKLPKIIIQDKKFTRDLISSIKSDTIIKLDIDEKYIEYFVKNGIIENQAYDLNENSINILYKSGELIDITRASDHLNLLALTKTVVKHFIYYPK